MDTNERDERLKQIRERQGSRQGFLYGQDIDFLLSLLDSQAVQRPTGWQAAGVQANNPRNVLITFETPECASAFMDSIEPAVGPIVAATRMRDKCVEAVKAMCREWHDRYIAADSSSREALVRKEMLFAQVCATRDIITALSSLTLDQVEQKQ